MVKGFLSLLFGFLSFLAFFCFLGFFFLLAFIYNCLKIWSLEKKLIFVNCFQCFAHPSLCPPLCLPQSKGSSKASFISVIVFFLHLSRPQLSTGTQMGHQHATSMAAKPPSELCTL